MEALLNDLNPQQKQAVEATQGPVLVVAGAGSGKTRVITTRITYLCERGVSPYQILAMTFTNKAALEMKTRVAAMLGQSVRDLTVTTFHSFCARFLRREIEVLDRDTHFAIFDTQDQTSVLKRVIKSMDLSEKNYPPAMYRNRFSYAKNHQGTSEIQLKAEQDQAIFDQYQKALEEQNALDFDDLLCLSVKILDEHPQVRERYQQRFQYIMVDEYQDTNTIQAQLIHLLLNENRNLCVVGDEDQSIYGWRGADIRNILDFEIHFPDAQIFKLEQNYRSTQNILDYANQVIAKNEMRKPKKLWTSSGQGNPISIWDEWTSAHEAERIIQTIERLHRDKGADYHQFAILFRSNFLSRGVEEMCRRYQIPYQLIGGLKFYDRKEIKDLLAFMRITVNPRDWTSFTRAIGVPPRGVGSKSLDRLFALFEDGHALPELLDLAISEKTIGGKGFKGLQAFRDLYARLREEESKCKPHAWLSQLIDALGYREYLEKIDDATVENRVANVDELLESMRELERQGVETLSQFMDFSALFNDQDEYDEDQPKVNLMTVHAAKGLEFDTVFVMGLEDGVFPNQRSMNDNPNALEEERRLFYVAVTRARQRLYLSYARRRQTYGTTNANPKSRFLIAIDFSDGRETQDSFLTAGKKKAKLADLSTQIQKMEQQLADRNVPVDFGNLSGKAGKTPVFRMGDTVRHKKFGTGTVAMVAGKGDQQTVQVYFPGKGKKTLVAKMAKLEKL